MMQVLHGLHDLWECFLQCADIMAFVDSMNDTLGANWRASAVKAEVADLLFWMVLAGISELAEAWLLTGLVHLSHVVMLVRMGHESRFTLRTWVVALYS